MPKIDSYLKSHIQLIEKLLTDEHCLSQIEAIIQLMMDTFNQGGRVLFCGNGGSAADAEHLAGELSGRFKLDRAALDAEALHVNSAALTAISNDFGYDKVFERILSAKGKKGDVLYCMTTSGSSANVIKALQLALKTGINTVLISGQTELNDKLNHHLIIPADDTPRIQEAMMLIGHIICEEVEKRMFS